jgi:hypothetical protein
VNRSLTIAAGVVIAAVAGVFIFWTPSRPEPEKPKTAAVAAPAKAPAATTPLPEFPPAPAVTIAPKASKPKVEKAEKPAEAVPEAPPANVGVLRIDADVAGAQVFLDRVFLGPAPVTAQNVTPGSHHLNVSAPGYESVSDSIDVAAGPRDVTVKLREVRLNTQIDVVHKHRIGSCKGRLIATPQGLRYETSDKNDGFSAPLLDLDGFEVDYMQKNLKIQIKKGKKFDFTDPEGNADRLFVFHRDVDKARERLKKGDPPATSSRPVS